MANESSVPRDWIVAHASWTLGMAGEHKRDKLRALGEYEPRCADGILPLSAATKNRTSSDRARYPYLMNKNVYLYHRRVQRARLSSRRRAPV